MELNKGQEEARRIAIQRFKDGLRYVVIAGYAGTGKSTVVKYIVQDICEMTGFSPYTDVIYTAYTGKACEVLKKKGNENTSTLHKLLYESHLKADGGYIRRKIKFVPYKIIVIDECSMVPPDMVEQLATFQNVFCIFLGDSGQLPPISEKANNGLLNNPHYILTQIMRQEEGGEIVEIATKIRLGEDVPYMKGENVMVAPHSQFSDGMLLWADIILCATNKTRQELNAKVRQLKGYTEPLVTGEQIICLKNNWEEYSLMGSPLMNGQLCTITSDIEEKRGIIPRGAGVRGEIPYYYFDMETDVGEPFVDIKAEKNIMLYEQSILTPQQRYKIMHNQYGFILPDEFTYGYCITTWKAQGSEFKKVLIVEEAFPFDKKEHRQFMYTALTRASEKVVWIKK